ncbi:hypothetical protein EVX99_13370 [Citrobacter koseri]|nr:hypothetical protein EVX99_13370 [Citrobacter koseri]
MTLFAVCCLPDGATLIRPTNRIFSVGRIRRLRRHPAISQPLSPPPAQNAASLRQYPPLPPPATEQSA